MTITQRHQTRSIRFLGTRIQDNWSIKTYGIATFTERPRDELLSAALARLPGLLPAPSELSAQTHGEAFVIVHDGGDGCYVLVDWFANENEVHQRVLSAPLNTPDRLAPQAGHAIGCVWELAIVDFERRAWLDHVLSPAAGPDFAAYRRTYFEGEL